MTIRTEVHKYTLRDGTTGEYERAVGVKCAAYHSGNRDLCELQRGSWQCCGCGATYPERMLLEPLPSYAEVGRGGVIRR